MDEITEQYDRLLEFPFLGRRRPELGTEYRSLAVGNYVIFYRVSEMKLEISRVLHGSRDLSSQAEFARRNSLVKTMNQLCAST